MKKVNMFFSPRVRRCLAALPPPGRREGNPPILTLIGLLTTLQTAFLRIAFYGDEQALQEIQFTSYRPSEGGRFAIINSRVSIPSRLNQELCAVAKGASRIEFHCDIEGAPTTPRFSFSITVCKGDSKVCFLHGHFNNMRHCVIRRPAW